MLVWPCLSLTEKQHTINQMTIFNDSVSKFNQCSISGFCWGISMIFSVCLGRKKNEEAIKFLRILKRYVSKNKIYFCFKKKGNVSLIKKAIFVFHTIFKLDFITQIIYWINPSLTVNLTKVQQQNEWKKKPGLWEYGPWVCNWAN